MLQEVITEAGSKHVEFQHWQLVFGKLDGEFMGEAVAHKSNHKHQQTQVLPGALTTTLVIRKFRVLAGHPRNHTTSCKHGTRASLRTSSCLA